MDQQSSIGYDELIPSKMTLHCLQRLPEIQTRLVQNNGIERFPDIKWSFCSLLCLQPWLLPGRHLGCRMEQVCPSMWHPKLESYPSSMESPWRHQPASHLSGRDQLALTWMECRLQLVLFLPSHSRRCGGGVDLDSFCNMADAKSVRNLSAIFR